MCGIFGFAKTSNSQSDHQLEILKRTFTYLTEESSRRGTDSTGFSIMNPVDRYTYKTLTDSVTLTRTNEWQNVIDKIDRKTSIVLGHTRFATTGAKVVNNAHPFTIGEVVGIHNGVIYNYNQVARSLGKTIPQVDSEVIFQSLNRLDKSKAFENINGDFAVAWAKENNTTLHLARESGRPMVVSYWKKAKVLFFASTRSIMEDAMIDAGLVLKIKNVSKDKIYSYNTNKFARCPIFDIEKFETISQTNNYISGSYYGGHYGYYNNYGSCDRDTQSYNDSYTKNYCQVCGDYTYVDNYCAEHMPDEDYSSMSPASKMLLEDNVNYCEVCYEETRDDELDYDDDINKWICIQCDFNSLGIEPPKLLTEGDKNEKGNSSRIS
tara:strand:- start:844 stop:1980 length:1137 start_codon:yes stop_codon:yes gene_type:complete